MNTSQVEINRNKDDDLVVHAIPENRGAALLDALSTFDNDFIDILEENYRAQPTLLPTDESLHFLAK